MNLKPHNLPTITEDEVNEGKFVDSRGIKVLTATRGNVLTLAGFLFGLEEGIWIEEPQWSWLNVKQILLIHPRITDLEPGFVPFYTGTGIERELHVVCNPSAPSLGPSLATVNEKKHPVIILNEFGAEPVYQTTQGGDGVFTCKVSALGVPAEGTGQSIKEAKTKAAETVLPLLPISEPIVHVRRTTPAVVLSEIRTYIRSETCTAV